jgi:hypothetical protein
MQLQWFHNGGALMGETNATMCLQADWNTEGDYILNGVTDEGVFVSPNANLQITRPYLYQLSRTQNGQWAITGLALYDRYQPLSLQASSNLINWQVVTNWPYGNSLPFRVELPPQPGTARFFRLNQ